MNIYEKQSILQTAIEDAERRLGQYCASEGVSLTDRYAQAQINCIRYFNDMLLDLYEYEISLDNENLTD